jgi:hypothetical protein
VVTRAALVFAALAASVLAAAPSSARASSEIRYGVQDDAWLIYGPGSIDERVAKLRRLGVDVVRFQIRWDEVARRRPRNGRNHRDRAYDWRLVDPVVRGLRRARMDTVITLVGTPAWANGGRRYNWAPTSGRSFANFVAAISRRYPWVDKWTIWNEPNQRDWLRPTTGRTYVERLLNPAYAELHRARRRVRVAGGMSAPRAGTGGVSPVAWIRSLRAAGARLDAYAHHPYPLRPRIETPWRGGCRVCATITMAELDRLIREVRRNFPGKRIWLTEYGYQTNPPDRFLGVRPRLQARYFGSAARRVYLAPLVDMLINFMVRDDRAPSGWQSGFFTASGQAKLAYRAFRMPVTVAARKRRTVRLWGQIRPRSGRRLYRLERFERGRWRRLGGVGRTDTRGFFRITVGLRRNLVVRVWSPSDRAASVALRLG